LVKETVLKIIRVVSGGQVLFGHCKTASDRGTVMILYLGGGKELQYRGFRIRGRGKEKNIGQVLDWVQGGLGRVWGEKGDSKL